MRKAKRQHASEHWVTGVCETGKRAFDTRHGAKAHNSEMRGRGLDRLDPYDCPKCDYWHLGHLPSAVIHGYYGRGEYYGKGTQ